MIFVMFWNASTSSIREQGGGSESVMKNKFPILHPFAAPSMSEQKTLFLLGEGEPYMSIFAIQDPFLFQIPWFWEGI